MHPQLRRQRLACRSLAVLCASLLACAATAPRAQTNCAEPAPDTPIEALDVFSNTRYTEEHAYGYEVELWRAGTCLIGMLLYSEGLQDATPTGLLENVRYDAVSGALSFGARLSTIRESIGANGEQVAPPSQDYFTFRGTLDLERMSLEGTFEHQRRTATSAVPGEPETVVLPAGTSPRALYPDAATYGEWRQKLEPILQARGPKW